MKAKEEKQVDPVVLYSRDVRRDSEAITKFGKPVEDLVERMNASMLFYNGIGLAACQINVFERVFIAELKGKIEVFVNPYFTIFSSEKQKNMEGCLSLPGGLTAHGKPVPIEASVERHKAVKIRFQDVTGEWHDAEYEGFEAAIVQHEYDHLNGMFFIDRLSPLKRQMVLNRFNKFVHRSLKREA